jgi:hypothetical protein
MIRTLGRRRLHVLSRLTLAMGALWGSSATDCRAGGLIPFDFDQNRPLILATDGSVSYSPSTGSFSVQATGLFFLSNNLPNGVP